MTFALLVSLVGCSNGGSTHLRAAEELSRQHQYDQAIAEYRLHMQQRLKVKNRPEWENPSFYLILIGDLFLSQSNLSEARASYDQAEKDGVDSALVSDRYRTLARWYEEHGELNAAFNLLKSRRDKDPILFDSMLDRLAKAITAHEENAAHNKKS